MLEPGRYIKISIKDTGVGIAKEIIERVFDPFFTTKQKGSGLGLAISYSIVKKHKGFIEVESEPSRGSTFNVFLPASDKNVTESNAESVDFIKGTGKILIMDDEKVIRDSVSTMLNCHGYTTVLSVDGKEALRLFDEYTQKGEKLNAVVLDLTVPGGKGGKEIIAEIRKRDKNIPVFVTSGYTEDAIVSKPNEFGFTDSIKKPFTRFNLISMLAKYL